jgi:hypothetical protein
MRKRSLAHSTYKLQYHIVWGTKVWVSMAGSYPYPGLFAQACARLRAVPLAAGRVRTRVARSNQ